MAGLLVASSGCHRSRTVAPPRIAGHPVRVDAARQLLAWSPGEDASARRGGGPAATKGAPYARVARLAWTALETKFPADDRGLAPWLTYSRFDPTTFEGIAWPHNPAGLYAMLTESALLWYAFSGDRAAIALATTALDYQLAHGTTPDDWDWARVPYASSGAGDLEYRGADDAWCDYCGRGDGIGVIEPDKVGELGFAYAQMFELTSERRYLDAAVACADALAHHVRPGDERASPWPFRVHARTNAVREAYTSNVVGALMLFDALAKIAPDPAGAYARARRLAFDWLMRVPLRNDAWSGYFEDIAIQPDPTANPNQYSPMRTARWLMAHRDEDAQWREHVEHLLSWVAAHFGGDTGTERGLQWGAVVVSEQAADVAKMGSHTARFGATLAMWADAIGDSAARERASRSLNWATYMCGDDGIVAVGEDANEGWWFSDGYGDYIRHFLVAMGAVPDWAPAGEDHIVRSTSLVTDVAYEPSRVRWTTFDLDAVDTLRLRAAPTRVACDGVALPQRTDVETSGDGYALRPAEGGGVVAIVRHHGRGPVTVEHEPARASAPASLR